MGAWLSLASWAPTEREATELEIAVEQGGWRRVCEIIESGVCSQPEISWAIEEGIKHAADIDLTYYVLPHCPSDQLEHVLVSSASRRCWGAVGKILQKDVPHSLKRRAVDQASQFASQSDFQNHVLPHCPADMRDKVAREISLRGFWRVLSKLLHAGVSPDTHRWVLQEASKHAREHELITHILPHCHSDEEKQEMLTEAVDRGLWTASTRLYGLLDIDHNRQKRIVGEAKRRAQFSDDIMQVLAVCGDEQELLESLLDGAVERELWHAASVLLQHVSEDKRRLVINEVSEDASELAIMDYDLLRLCPDEHMKAVLKKLQEQGLWHAIAHLVKQRDGPDKKTYYVPNSMECSPESTPQEFVLLHCTDGDLDIVFKAAMDQKFWRVVGALMRRPVTQDLKEKAVRKMCRGTSSFYLVHYITIFKETCSSTRLGCMLDALVERDLWDVVGVMLSSPRVNNDNKKKNAIRMACKNATDRDLDKHIVPNCPYQLQTYLEQEKAGRSAWDLRRIFRHIVLYLLNTSEVQWLKTQKSELKRRMRSFESSNRSGARRRRRRERRAR